MRTEPSQVNTNGQQTQERKCPMSLAILELQNKITFHPGQATIRKQKTTNIDKNVKSKRKEAYTHLICISLGITTMEICIEDLQNTETAFTI